MEKKVFNVKIDTNIIVCDYCGKTYEKEFNDLIKKNEKKEAIELKLRDKFKRCSKCKLSIYCSKECQKKDWLKHKEICFKSELELKSGLQSGSGLKVDKEKENMNFMTDLLSFSLEYFLFSGFFNIIKKDHSKMKKKKDIKRLNLKMMRDGLGNETMVTTGTSSSGTGNSSDSDNGDVKGKGKGPIVVELTYFSLETLKIDLSLKFNVFSGNVYYSYFNDSKAKQVFDDYKDDELIFGFVIFNDVKNDFMFKYFKVTFNEMDENYKQQIDKLNFFAKKPNYSFIEVHPDSPPTDKNVYTEHVHNHDRDHLNKNEKKTLFITKKYIEFNLKLINLPISEAIGILKEKKFKTKLFELNFKNVKELNDKFTFLRISGKKVVNFLKKNKEVFKEGCPNYTKLVFIKDSDINTTSKNGKDELHVERKKRAQSSKKKRQFEYIFYL
jgi:radical SAM protein with 4Fe4S-binding SPASM domain